MAVTIFIVDTGVVDYFLSVQLYNNDIQHKNINYNIVLGVGKI